MDDESTMTRDQLQCLSSPVRADVFQAVRHLGRCSAREIAELTGKSPEGVHYHLKQLESAGLIQEVEKRPAPRKPESVYEPTSRRLRLPGPDASVEDRELIRRTVANGLREVVRGYEAASLAGDEDVDIRNQMSIVRAHLRLSEQDLETFIELVNAAAKFAVEHRKEDGLRLQWSSVVFPVVKGG